MHADYLEIKKKFLSHAKPYKEGSKKYNKTQKILNTASGGNRTVRDEYKQLLSLARMWQTGKRSMDELANSMGQTEFRVVSSIIQSSGNINEERLVRTVGYTKADLDVVKDFVSAYREYKGPARHSALSHAYIPSNVPSYYRGNSNVSKEQVYDQARYKAHEEFAEKLGKYKLDLSQKTVEMKKAKQGYDAYPGLKKEVENLQKLVDRYTIYVKNTKDTQSAKNVRDEISREKQIKEAGRFLSKSFIAGKSSPMSGGFVGGMAKTLVDEQVNPKFRQATSVKTQKANAPAEFYWGKDKKKRGGRF